MTQSVFLIGMMASGKTTIGRHLASVLRCRFVDADRVIEQRAGADISWIFDLEGEDGFRDREQAVIDELTGRDGIVLATGGGAVLREINRSRLRERGVVVYLDAPLERLVARTRNDRKRPPAQRGRRRGHPRAATGRTGRAVRGHRTPHRTRRRRAAPLDRQAHRQATRHHGTMGRQQPLTVTVNLGERSYPIRIGRGLLGEPGLFDPFLAGSRAMVVTNGVVGEHYLERTLASLPGRVRAETLTLPDGEAFKTLATFSEIIDALVAGRHDRGTTIIALGGGVVGDVAGFAASAYQRGVAYIQVPTTLLALVDSSVGGKTAVNHPGGKNLIGAFHQPRCVIADLATLDTLPERELRAGLAEVIKYGVIFDAGFFAWIEAHLTALLARDTAALRHAVARSCEIKAEVVRADEREAGTRMILNYGHTFGHALEAVTGYGTLLHGEAVAIGMVLAADLAARRDLLPAKDADRIREVVSGAGLPVAPPPVDADAILTAMGMDKKAASGRIRLVLPVRIGAVEITDRVPPAAITAVLEGTDQPLAT